MEEQTGLSPGFEVPRKYPLFACAASLFIPGAGQAFCGRIWRGLGFFLGWTVAAAACSRTWSNLLFIPLILLPGWAAWDAYRCGLDRARREFESSPPTAPPTEQPPVPKPVRLFAALTACWLLPNGVFLAAMTIPFIFFIPAAIVSALLAQACLSRGQEALTLAKGLRFRTVANGWTGTKRTVEVRGLEGAFSVCAAAMFGWLIMFAAVNKFAELARRPNEKASIGNLGSIRSALSIYYGDMEGQYPSDIGALTVGGKYISILPKAKAPSYHSDSSAIYFGKDSNDAGGWLYNNVVGDANIGNVFVNCTHTDTQGRVWTYY